MMQFGRERLLSPEAHQSAEEILSAEIADGESIVRAVKSPFHLKSKTKLKRQAFHPPSGKNVISVMRQLMGDDFCKDKGVIVAQGPNAKYVGLAAGRADLIRAAGVELVDFPADFPGHAHIEYPFFREPGEATNSRDAEKQNEIYDKLLSVMVYYPDPAPESPGWSGPPLDSLSPS